MMAEQHTHICRILDGWSSLGRSDILPGTLTVDGGAIPAGLNIDYVAGEVQWTDQNNLGPPGPYTFVFQWERPLAFQQAAARRLVKAKAEDKLDALDDTFVGGSLVQDFMTQEVIVYDRIEGRPASPSAAVYSTAAVLQPVRGDATLRDTLEWMRTGYISLKNAANAIISQRFDYLDQIDAASTIAEVESIVSSVESW